MENGLITLFFPRVEMVTNRIHEISVTSKMSITSETPRAASGNSQPLTAQPKEPQDRLQSDPAALPVSMRLLFLQKLLAFILLSDGDSQRSPTLSSHQISRDRSVTLPPHGRRVIRLPGMIQKNGCPSPHPCSVTARVGWISGPKAYHLSRTAPIPQARLKWIGPLRGFLQNQWSMVSLKSFDEFRNGCDEKAARYRHSTLYDF